MNLLCWNCRGLGNPWTVRELHSLVKNKKPNFLFLIETKVYSGALQRIRLRLGYEGMIHVDPVGRSGGLAFFWRSDSGVEIMHYSPRHISANIWDRKKALNWTFTGFYGNPNRDLRDESWSLLSHLKSLSNDAWLCMGDFNEVVDHSEKYGGAMKSEAQMERFRTTLVDCNLGDLGFQGSKFTWSNSRDSEEFIKERLDRAVATPRWCEGFPNAAVEVLSVSNSDHKPLLLIMEVDYRKPNRLFRYEAKWNLDEECQKVIQQLWNEADTGRDSMEEVLQNLDRSRETLNGWSRNKFGAVTRTINSLSRRLGRMQRYEIPGNLESIKQIKGELNKLLEMEDVKWRQRAKTNWFIKGDRNTQFFHAWANQRRRSNFIGSIRDLEGHEWTRPEEVGNAFTRYFQNLFETEGVTGIEECTSAVQVRVKPELNAMLTSEFTHEEVNTALSQMHPLKSPGPDGLGASFYQHHWGTIGAKVRGAVLDFLNRGNFNTSINETFIALIPKMERVSNVADFRPISLCNVIYKLVSKVLANRLKLVLPSIISQHQSAFVPGRLITDNILIAYEALHTMNSRMKGKKGFMAAKIDMRKAYDRVEWPFLEAMMRTMGFEERWITLVMTCVRSVTYSILVNSQPYGKIVPSRGLRQGDPLSPYLFLIVAEGLSSLMAKAEAENRITGVPIAAGGFRLSHLFFADDSLLFCRANFPEWLNLAQVLQTYEKASGQQLNMAKTSVFFSRNTREEFKEFIRNSVGVATMTGFEKYLGLPTLVGRSKKRTFAYICGRVKERLDGWKEKFLSQAGKEVLIKAVVQALPTFCMSVFRLPQSLCKSLNSLISHFWWGQKTNKGRVQWMSWERMGAPKNRGGMGFRDLEVFNLALLAKQGWRILTNPSSLVARVMKEKYHPRANFLEATVGRRPSFVWRSIINAKHLLQNGMGWRVGNGANIKIWGDAWLSPPHARLLPPSQTSLHPEARVNMLIDPVTGWWDFNLVRRLFDPGDVAKIGSVLISPLCQEDKMIWRGTTAGTFTVRSAYYMELNRLAQDRGEGSGANAHVEVWKTIWGMHAPPVLKNFCWKVCNNLLPTKANLHKRKIVDDPLCPLCTGEPETVFHSIWGCPAAVAVWQEGVIRFQKMSCILTDGMGLFLYLMERLDPEEFVGAWTVARMIWMRRNDFVFNGVITPPTQTMEAAKISMEGFKTANDRDEVSTSVEPVQRMGWKKPSEGSWKINWDAAISKEKLKMGVGIVIRDAEGRLVAAKTKTVPYIVDPTAAETMAAWFAVEFGRELGAARVVLEGDSLVVVSGLRTVDPCNRFFGQLIDDIKSSFSHFSAVEVRHVRREANTAAHELAKCAISLLWNNTWVGVCPAIESIVEAECLSS